jgi:hypothetical protein
MIARAILRSVAHGCDDIVRNAGNIRLLSSRFGVNLANVVARTECVLSWYEGPFGFRDELTEVRAAWDAANGFVTRIRGVFGPVLRGIPSVLSAGTLFSWMVRVILGHWIAGTLCTKGV